MNQSTTKAIARYNLHQISKAELLRIIGNLTSVRFIGGYAVVINN